MKIYLDISIFNYYYNVESDFQSPTVQLFKEISIGKFEPYTSNVVIDELEESPDENRLKKLSLISKFNIIVLKQNDIADKLTNLYIENKIISEKCKNDAFHIALPIVNCLNTVLTLRASTELEE
jgi:predicted nucleic acid-binding protein